MNQSASEAPSASVVDRVRTSFINFLLETCPPLIGCSRNQLQATLTHKAETELLRKFVIDLHTRVLIVGKELEHTGRLTKEELKEDDDGLAYNTFISLEIDKRATSSTSVAFIKRSPLSLLSEGDEGLEAVSDSARITESLGTKLQILNIGILASEYEERGGAGGGAATSPFEVISNYLQYIADPIFATQQASTALIDQTLAEDEAVTSNRNITIARKKLAELLVSVQQVQQNVEVPLVQLIVDPVVRDFVSKCKAKGKKFSPEDFVNEISDTSIMNQLQAGVNKWIKDTQKVVKIDRDPATGTTAEEVNFWVGFERALFHIEQQLQIPDVEATLTILKFAKRFLAAVSFEIDTGLKAKMESVMNVNLLMRDFPMNDLLAANSIEQLTVSIRNIFTHLKRLKNATHYPYPRAYKLVEAISRDLNTQLHKVLSGHRLLIISFDEFDHLFNNCRELSRVWDEEVRRFKELIRDQIKKKGMMNILPSKLNCEHVVLLDRVEDIRRVRRQHEKLQDVVKHVLPGERRGESTATKDIHLAYSVFASIEALDISRTGQDVWEAAKKQYTDKIDRVESQITNKLRDRLGAAKTGAEMFRVFSQFNPLFFRPRIRGAIQEYQASLIQQVKNDLKALQLKYNETYERSEDKSVAEILDIPHICGEMIWSKQLERKLETSLRRVEDVLGKGWEQHTEGQNLKQSGEEFSRKLNPQAIFDPWIKEIKDAKTLDVGSRIFGIKQHGGRGYELLVNYDPKVMFLFKEVRFLTAMGIRVPYSVKVTADDAKWIYPYLMSLQESIRTFTHTCLRLEGAKYETIAPLIASYKQEVQQILQDSVNIRWDYEKLSTFTSTLCAKVYMLESKMEDCEMQTSEINELVERLKTVEYTADGIKFKECIQGIQKIVFELSLSNYSNLAAFVVQVDEQLETILATRLEGLIQLWLTEFENWPHSGTSLIQHGSLHEFKVQSRQLYLFPPIEAARQQWTTEFHKALGTICQLPRLSVFDEELLGGEKAEKSGLRLKYDRTFRVLMEKIAKEKLSKAYTSIYSMISNLIDYVNDWLKYQYLWDIEVSSVLAKVGEDLEAWQQLLTEIRASRSTFDTSEEHKTLGPIVVDYSTAQQKVMTKFESWHREILNVFGSKIFDQVSQFSLQLRQAKDELEMQADPSKLTFLTASFSGTTDTQKADVTSRVTQFVSRLQKTKQQETEWVSKLEHFSASEKLLERQRYAFPPSWIWIDGVTSEWEAFQQLLRHQSQLLERHRTHLQMMVLDYDKWMQETLTNVYADWAKTRPVQGDTQPQFALQAITRMEGKLVELKGEYERVSQAKTALEMAVSKGFDSAKVTTSGLTPQALEEELQSLKGVWTQLKDLYASLDSLKETPWSAVAPKKVRQGLTDLLETIKKIPAKFRQYEAFEHLQNCLNEYLKMNMLLTEMKSDALKERHWKRILEVLQLRSNIGLSNLTLGHLWDAKLPNYDVQVRDILSQAQGELALEEFLHMLRDTWNEYELELVVYKNRCKLIKHWDDMFQLMDEHLNSLQSMKVSPFYKIFEEEANNWDDKLSRLRVLLDAWMEVQRRWVYLEGVFTGSADIQALLPNEFNRFRSIDNDFLAIMKKTAGRPKVLDIAATEGLQRSLDRLLDLLSKIQKALGEYLERQRLEFPRFYFVGDEDLLEMIGNSKDVKIVQRHLNKMFAGIANFITSPEESDVIIGMASKEGENVPFVDPVKIADHSSLNAWLRSCEKMMTTTIAELLNQAINELEKLNLTAAESRVAFFEWMAKYPCQVVMLAMQIDWTNQLEHMLKEGGASLPNATKRCDIILEILADQVLHDCEKLLRIKIVQQITEMVHQRDVCRQLLSCNVQSEKDFKWLQYMRFYWDAKNVNTADRFSIRMGNASFNYGFEYLGIPEKLVQTPLTDKCYLTLTQALHLRLGGNPFGPAGTGKTETVKALGAQLGRLVLVFCCDEAFDFQAMGRIFVGLCQVGAWGCFDEFNRLEERILSACSEQILTIQTGLKRGKTEIELMNKVVKLNNDMGIFVTMNPGYAGRSNLPDNLKQLFREIAMINPDKVQITQVLLYSQGFRSAEKLSSKVVALFDLCLQQLSHQSHYDFGLRSLKSVLSSAGNLKRQSLMKEGLAKNGDAIESLEKGILLRSICDTMVPKLVAQDVPLLRSLLQGVFPGADLLPVEEAMLEEEVRFLCQARHLEPRPSWLTKVLQLYQIQRLNHGVMLVGPVGTGKSTAWHVLLDAMEKLDGQKGYSYILDAKSVPKEQLYGRLDPTTLEWTDGMFTALLRKILNNVHGASCRRHWIIFDGDVDPEWAENLNSVLDDNKLLTLPNGERLQIQANVRLIFEVDSLRFATLATVSRCGMVWFSEDVLPEDAIALHFLNAIRCGDIEDTFHQTQPANPATATGGPARLSSRHRVSFDMSQPLGMTKEFDMVTPIREGSITLFDEETPRVATGPPPTGQVVVGHQTESEKRISRKAVEILLPFFEAGGFVSKCLERASELPHIMDFTKIRVLESAFSLLRKFISQCIEHEDLYADSRMGSEHLEKIITKGLVFSICWGCGGSMALAIRQQFCQDVASLCNEVPLPPELDNETTLLDFELRISDGEWHHWRERVVSVEIEPHQVQDANVVIETIDTIRHRAVLAAWLEEKKPFILCGPPGSGKTMTLTSTLKGLSDFDIASLNFSSGTTPELLLKTFDHYCEYVKTTGGVVLRPTQPGKWLIVFADEINLPEPDKYATQRVIMFMRQMQEYSGFWRSDGGQWSWVKMERIQFAGACNPPTDAGRHPMSNRFLRHAPLMFVDFPGAESLRQIYGTFSRAMLRRISNLRPYGDHLTNAMVEFYRASQNNFTVDQQPHYIYSPRELTRWKIAMYEALSQRDHVELSELVRLFIHEGLRIFQDRLVEENERQWTDETMNSIVMKYLSSADLKALKRPILYCCYLTKHYEEVQREDLREMILGKLRVFNEEELNVQLVLFDQVLDHITRIDRVLRQPLGHLLLVGASGAGKTVLSKFVSWLNGLSVFQIKAGRNYDIIAFEADLRIVMKRSGLKDEKITFIFDESNALGPAFLERMNALLASGEVPGLFEGDEYISLISEAKQCYGADTGTDEADLFIRFTKEVQRNLHIVFTMNPANPDFANRQATSPALFNRCVIDWFGDWPHDALLQVAMEFTRPLELSPDGFEVTGGDEDRRNSLSSTVVAIHESVVEQNERLMKSGKKHNYLTPRDFLDFIRHFIRLVEEKKAESLDNTKHLNVGLSKLKETEHQVETLQESLALKEVELQEKNQQAEEKMQLMVEQQAVAEERKKDAEALAVDLDQKSNLIANRRREVEVELKEVEPLLREAESAVSNIPKKYLDELRALANPPHAVKLTVEAVVVMLNNMGNNPLSWDDCRKALKGGDFINRVISFDSNSTSPVTVARIKQKYLDTENWDTDKIMRASKAAGPLAKWVESSISFQVIVQKVDPLRNEIQTLEREHAVNQRGLRATQTEISSLEERLQSYKTEYAQLISDVQMIKKEMEAVKSKVQRSSQLLKNLASEKVRWSTALSSSKDQLVTSIGDGLLAGAFCTYLGFFEHGDRSKLIYEWQGLLEEGSIKYLSDLALVEYLSKPSDRFQWTSHALPTDELSIENAIILQRYIRYPLIIDPSGQASAFLTNKYVSRKLVKTSFIDTSFFKNLESALRFGTPLLVQDVEKIDPILNSVLNQETHKAGGRVLITVGDSDIDFSPLFTMFLTTRDPTAQFTPDLCSRVTFVNFTLTPSSLQNQCLNLVLKSERPDVDKKRSDVLKLQGEFRIRIRELEDSLLYALSNVKGNILDDDSVISTLESLKAQAAEVAEEVERVDEVMNEVNKTSAVYLPLAQAAARLYFTLQSMHHLHFLYHYDLYFFESLFHDTLKDIKEKSKASGLKADDYNGRLYLLFELLFRNLYVRCGMGLLYQDRLVFALQLGRIRYESEFDTQLGGRDLDLLLQGELVNTWDETSQISHPIVSEASGAAELTTAVNKRLTLEQIRSIISLRTLPTFMNLPQHMITNSQIWEQFLDHSTPENAVPPGAFEMTSFDQAEEAAFEDVSEHRQKLHRDVKNKIRESLIIKALRPDRELAALTKLVELICGKDFSLIPEVLQEDLHQIVTKQLKSMVPVVLVSAPGFDPSSKVVWASQRQNQHIASIAMGSEEGYTVADNAISSAARQGTWVLLKNVHLSSSWLHDLEKKLFRMHLHENFRIFLTMEFSPKVPSNLFRVSFVFVFEPPAGLKASMQRSYSQMIIPPRTERQPMTARARLHFLLAFLHAVILERKRYTPFGWSKHYEFSDADQQCALEVIDQWVDIASTGTWAPKADALPEHLDPKKIPFEAIRTLLRDAVYGGRLDNEVDIRALASFVDHLFNPEAFESDFALARGYEGSSPVDSTVSPLIAPELGRSRDHYIEFIDKMRNIDEPLWLGLAPRADRLISARQGSETLAKWFTLHSKSADDLQDLLPSAAHALGATRTMTKMKMLTKRLTRKLSGPVGWIAELQPRVTAMMQLLPEGIRFLERSDKSVQNPLFRCFDREVNAAARLLQIIKSQLTELKEVCEGRSKFTNTLRELARNISGGTLPKEWIESYKTVEGISFGEWLTDFCKRVAQLASVGLEFGGGPVSAEDPQINKYLESVETTLGAGKRPSQRLIWLGGLSFPSAFLTATRQAVAQRLKSSLDDLKLVVDVGVTGLEDNTFTVGGIILENASWDHQKGTLALTDSLTYSLPPLRLRWLPSATANEESGEKRVLIPMFLTRDRAHLITMVELAVPKDEPSNVWYQRGVALILWSQI